jgi:4-oxalocrotonate tautomerase
MALEICHVRSDRSLPAYFFRPTAESWPSLLKTGGTILLNLRYLKGPPFSKFASGRGEQPPQSGKEHIMPFVNIKLVEGVFSTEQKHAMAEAISDVMVKFEGSEAFREVVWVLIEELHKDGWHIGGRPFMGPASLMETLRHSKNTVEAIKGNPTTHDALAEAMPVIPR